MYGIQQIDYEFKFIYYYKDKSEPKVTLCTHRETIDAAVKTAEFLNEEFDRKIYRVEKRERYTEKLVCLPVYINVNLKEVKNA